MIDYSSINIGTPIKEYTLDSIKFSKLVNTNYFSEAANDYLKNEKLGFPLYTRAIVGSKEFEDYWDLQEKRCREGFTVGDLWITGRQYFYLNFFRILRSPPKDAKDKNKVASVVNKIESFPSFWAIQHLWFTYKHIAHWGGRFLGVESAGGLDICALKTRGAGFSFMDASDDAYNFMHIRKSKSYVFAYMSEYLMGKDGIMPKIQITLDFLNQATRGIKLDKTYSAGAWKRNRYNIGSEPESYVSGYKDLDGNVLGWGSEIHAVICDNERKARGKRGMKITIEEGGSFPNLPGILTVSKALVKDGSTKTGQRVLFGTGGEEGEGILGLEQVFNNPSAFGFMSFPNIWEGQMDEVGFFCPSFLADAGCIDHWGNSDIQKHISTKEKEREALKKVSPKDYDSEIAEFPFVPSDALKRVSGNVYPTIEIEGRIKIIETRTHDPLVYGWIEDTGRGYDFIPRKIGIKEHEVNPILKWPHDQKQNLNGCITVKEKPYKEDGKVPREMYFIVVDNYGVDEAKSLTSLFAAYVYKYYNIYDNSYAKTPVCWYVGRPAKQDVAFEHLLKMSLWYNAEVMGEYNASGQQIITYFEGKQQSHMLMDELDQVGVEVQNKKKRKFMTISTDSKLANIGYHVDYLLEERYEDPITGNSVKNIHEIDDLGYLNEMKRFNLKKGNYDRISANSMAPLIMKRKSEKVISNLQQQSSYLPTQELFATFHKDYQHDNSLLSEY